jgi:predicted MPP superfamily phosphohydrolase
MTTADSQEGFSSPPYGPPGYRPNLIHIALVVTGVLGRLSPEALTPAWLAMAGIACYPWYDLRLVVAATSLTFTLVDGISLALLPRMGRSFGPVTPTLLALALVHTSTFFALGLIWPMVMPDPSTHSWQALLTSILLNLALSAVAFYATWIEPFDVGVTQEGLSSPKLEGESPLRLLHITDLHIEKITPRERQALGLVKELAPDVIVLTGDYLTLTSAHDASAHGEARRLLQQLCDAAGPHCPVFAITGSPPVDPPDTVPSIFEDLPITWLVDKTIELDFNGNRVRVAGVRCTADRHRDGPRLRRLLEDETEQHSTGRPFLLLLYHSPDLIPDAVELGVDLYLCGHTHGGQIRLPVFGAVFTSSDFGKRYEMGRYEEGHTTLYVSRGLGMEGLGAPRARFLAPPEIVLWTLSSQVETALMRLDCLP